MKVSQFLTLARDPDIADVVNRLFPGLVPADRVALNPNSNGARRKAAVSHVKVQRGKASPGNITAAIRAIGPRLPKTFTVKDIVAALEADAFAFKNDDHLQAVQNALYFINKKPDTPYRTIEQGFGGRISTYEYKG